MKSEFDWVRRGQRLIRMVSELHRMGYQRLRIMPWAHPQAWRLAISPADGFSIRNGAFTASYGKSGAVYTSADGARYFEWDDAHNDNARSLAEKFITRFPDVAQRGLGRDWEYAGWLAELIGFLEQGDWLPIVEWEFMKGKPEDLTILPIYSASSDNFAWEDEAISPRSSPSPNAHHFPLPPAWVEKDDYEHSSEPISADPTRLVRDLGGNLIRLREAIRGFRLKHSRWPTALAVGYSTLDSIKNHHLTPEGFNSLEKRLLVIQQIKQDQIVLRDNAHNEFDYSSEGWGDDQSVSTSDVDRWIWGVSLST